MLQCIVYTDMNMVRAGVVDHPERWRHGGYNEIQQPRRKCQIIDYKALRQLSGFHDLPSFQAAHRKWVLDEKKKDDRRRQPQWTEAVAVGSESFVQSVKKRMGFMAVGRQVRSSENNFELREDKIPYTSHFWDEKCVIRPKNACIWDENRLISG